MDTLYGKFDDTDRDMLGMLANQGAVALDNAGLLEGLEHKVQERTEELNARVDELAILNSVGEAMAKTLDVKTVASIVGDKVRDIFHAQGVSIMLLNTQTNMFHVHYEYDEEEGIVDYIEPFPLGIGLTTKDIQSRKPLLMGTLAEQNANGAYLAPEMMERSSCSTIAESLMLVPIIVSNKVLGVALVSNYKALIYGCNELLPGWTVMERLSEIQTPTLVLAGRYDFLFPPEHQAILADRLPNAQLAIIERAGHNPQTERPAEVIEAIQRFLLATISESA